MTYNEHLQKLLSHEDLLVKEALEADRRRGLTGVQLDYIYENELFHLLVPAKFGGAEMDLPGFAKLMEVYAKVDGNLAWVVNLGAGANMFAGFMDDEVAKEIFTDKRTCVAGSGAATGAARSKGDGFVINGEWKYASGSAHANWFSLNAVVDTQGKYKSFLVPREHVEILDTWKVNGMRATSSCNFKIVNAWVPADYQFDLQQVSDKTDSPLYRFPFKSLAEINMLVMLTGLSMSFTSKILGYCNQKAITIPRYNEQANLVNANRDQVFVLLDELWRLTAAKLPIEEDLSNDFSVAVNRTAQLCREWVDRLYAYGGMKVIFEDNEVSRVYRDFKVASQHGLLFPQHDV